MCANDGATVSTPSGWSVAVGQVNVGPSPPAGAVYIFYIANASSKSGSQSFTTSSFNHLLVLAEYSGIATSTPLDQTAFAINTETDTTLTTGTTGTTTQADELIVGGVAQSSAMGGSLTSPTNSFTLVDTASSVGATVAFVQRIVSSTGTFETSVSSADTGSRSGGLATFKAAASSTTYNETMSGGAYANGSPTIACRYTPSITSTGLMAGTSATTAVTYNLTTTGAGGYCAGTSTAEVFIGVSGGAYANGSPTIQETCNVTATGGGLLNGTAGTVTYNVTATGGGLLNGSGVATYNETMTGGGWLDGTASIGIGFVFQPTGGMYCSGSAPFTHNITMSGGAWLSGNSKNIYNEVATGGNYDSGNATVAERCNLTVSGGGWLSGGALVFSNVQGVYASGTATVRSTYRSITPTGVGGALGGDATDVEIWNFVPQAQGAMMKGSADVSVVTSRSVSGGVWLNGVRSFGVVTSRSASGGAYAAGSATVSNKITWLVTGGAYAAGSGSLVNSPLIVMSGGIKAAGTIAFAYTVNHTPSGGGKASGTATVQQIVLSPQAAVAGLWVAGTASFGLNVTRTPSGGMYAAGAATMLFTYKPSVLGGGKASGHASTNFNITTSGGVMCSGLYVARYHDVEVESFGLEARGTAFEEHIPFLVKVESCPDADTTKCGYEEDDQFCARYKPIQAHGSKFFQPKRRNPSIHCVNGLTGAPCVGSTAQVASITFCRQKLRTDPSDFPPRSILSIARPGIPQGGESFMEDLLGLPPVNPILERIRRLPRMTLTEATDKAV
jgi:hypothetical protein